MRKLAAYALNRTGSTLLLLFLVSVLCYVLLDLAPGSFFDELRMDPQISQTTITALAREHGQALSGMAGYGAWLWAALHGNPGTSFSYKRPVLELLAPRLKNTLLLTIPSFVFAWVIGIVLGVWSAAKKDLWLDHLAGFSAAALLTVPELVLGCLALLFAIRTGFVPVGGMAASTHVDAPISQLLDLLRHMILPVAVLTSVMVPWVFRHSRAAVLEVIDAPFVRSARAHGFSQRKVLFEQILPVAANPLISLFGVSVGSLISASFIIEVLFGWPGVGPLFLNAVFARDPYLILVTVLCSSVFLIIGNLVADVLLYVRDPRMRTA